MSQSPIVEVLNELLKEIGLGSYGPSSSTLRDIEKRALAGAEEAEKERKIKDKEAAVMAKYSKPKNLKTKVPGQTPSAKTSPWDSASQLSTQIDQMVKSKNVQGLEQLIKQLETVVRTMA